MSFWNHNWDEIGLKPNGY